MVASRDHSCPRCGHKRRRRSPLHRLASCPSPQAQPHPAKLLRSASVPTPSTATVLPEVNLRLAGASSSLPWAATSPVSFTNPCSPFSSAAPPAADIEAGTHKEDNKKEEAGKQEDKHEMSKKGAREMRIWGAEGVRITIKCSCGSVQEVAF
ncbi:hypothetical protein HPP92_002328 [Vanilla planifolia]|uniref:Uncharacterized protein n=1 Tax=Vanilla planifolia TaxID=51239 RepID=A0A835S557_VANPL|nr:hypothetical protein HPP92_002328 [Vanilla planifolia]